MATANFTKTHKVINISPLENPIIWKILQTNKWKFKEPIYSSLVYCNLLHMGSLTQANNPQTAPLNYKLSFIQAVKATSGPVVL